MTKLCEPQGDQGDGRAATCELSGYLIFAGIASWLAVMGVLLFLALPYQQLVEGPP